jgi:choice-of-anchor C domain-containing protein
VSGVRTVCALLVVSAIAVGLGPAVGGAGAVSLLTSRAADVSPSTHSLPRYGVSGVHYACLAADYSCTAGGYSAAIAASSGWPWQRYGAGYASTNAAGPHNCTLYAAVRLAQAGLADPGWHANANGWASAAAAHGATVDQTPTAGSIAQWNGGSLGHVAYVEAITPSGITITGDNYYTGSSVVNGVQLHGGYTERIDIDYGSPAWPDNFIHFAGIGTHGQTPAAGRNLVADGGFEAPPVVNVPTYDTMSAGSRIGPWTVTSGSVDLIDGYWRPAAGIQSLDLSGRAAGSISEQIATVPGESYLLRFALAANPECGPTVKRVQVAFGAQRIVFSKSISSPTRSSMSWVSESHVFKATRTRTTISFTSLADSSCGPVIDAVRVTAVSAQ